MFSVYIIYERWSHITSKITVISLKISGVLFFSIGTTTTVRRTRIMKIALDSLYNLTYVFDRLKRPGCGYTHMIAFIQGCLSCREPHLEVQG